MSEMGNLLLSIMQEKGLSYGILSSMTGISKATLQRYVSGTTENIPHYRLEIIAEALGVDVGYLCAKTTLNEMKLRGEYTSQAMEVFLDATRDKSRFDLSRVDELNGANGEEKPTIPEDDGLTENQRLLMQFARTVPADKAEMILRVMKSIVEAG